MIHNARLAPAARISPRARIALAIFVLIALVLDFLFFTGYFASDDLQYLTGARKIAALFELGLSEGTPGMGNSRLGITVPSGVIYWATGGSVGLVAWFHVAYHLALVGLAFVLGRLYRGERAGLIAAGIAATSPILYFFAGGILPDNATAAWLALVLLMIELVHRRQAADPPLSGLAASRWYFAIGFLFGVAYSCKDTALVFTVPAAVCLMASAPSLKSTVWIRNGAVMLAGLLAFFLIELMVLRLIMGEWVFRLSLVKQVGDVFLQRMATQGGANPLARFWFAVSDSLSSLAPISTWILLAGAVGYGFTRGRRLSLLLFFWFPFIYMIVGTTSFTAYRPATIQSRYFAIVIIPAAVMTAIAAEALWSRWRDWSRVPQVVRGRPALAAIAVAVLGVFWHELGSNLPESGNIYNAPAARALADAYQVARDDHPQYPILLGSRFGGRMQKFLAREADGRVYFDYSTTPPEPPYLVVGLLGDGAAPGDGELQVELLDIVYPARNRFEVVKRGFDRLFGVSPPDPPALDSPIVGTVELVSRPAPPSSLRPIAGPWQVMKGSARLRPLKQGHMLYWDQSQDGTLQQFERGSNANPPRHPLAQLDAGGRRLHLAVEVRLLSGTKARVGLQGFAYDPSGRKAAAGEAMVALDAGAAPTTIRLELVSGEPIAAFRVRLRVRAARAGSLFIAHPVLDEVE